jgi:hypothetical protein
LFFHVSGQKTPSFLLSWKVSLAAGPASAHLVAGKSSSSDWMTTF